MSDDNQPRIMVAGATGRIGGATTRALHAAGVGCTALIRSPERRAALADPTMDVRVADFADEPGLAAALEGVERLLLCSAHGPEMGLQQMSAVRAAERAGVQRVVKISASPASIFPGTPAEAAAAHLDVEDALRASRMRTVSVRPNAFAQVLLGLRAQIDSGTVRLPLADARVSWVDGDDVGRVAARLLAADDTPGQDVVEVTGPEGLTMDEACAAISAVVGRSISYEAVTDQQAREGLVARGVEPWYAEHMIGIFSLFRIRDAGRTTDAVQRITGSAATPLVDVLRRHRSSLVEST